MSIRLAWSWRIPLDALRSPPLNAAVDSCDEILEFFAAFPQRQGCGFQGSVPVRHTDSAQTKKKGGITYHHIRKEVEYSGNVFAWL